MTAAIVSADAPFREPPNAVRRPVERRRQRWLARRLLWRTGMRVLQLSAVVRDLRTSTMTVQPFLRSPVTIGRRESNALRLDAGSVSRIHGAFLFGRGILQYVDTGSRN